MKYLRVLLVALIAVCTFGTTQAQVRVRIGVNQHHYHHRNWHHRHYRHY